MRLSPTLVLIAAWPAVMVGCAQEVKDVNRVQPHYTKKSDLDGTWYYRQTVVESPPEIAFVFNGIEGRLEKVIFEIREDQLIARRSYEEIPGLEENEDQPGGRLEGNVVAAWNITSHFDIIRDFNEATGEQRAVLNEDTSLRPWYEREYMRIDWTSNSVEDGVDFGGFFSASSTNSYWVRETEAFNPDRMQEEQGFIQFTTAYTDTDYGNTCAFIYGGTYYGMPQCGSAEFRVRHSMVRIDPGEQAQFEALQYLDREFLRDEKGSRVRYVKVNVDGQMIDVACTPDVLERLAPEVDAGDCKDLQWDDFNRFGYFRTERHQWDRRVGIVDESRQFLANHHNIWKQVYETDEDGNVLRDQPIPAAERELRPVVYYTNVDFPDDLNRVAVQMGKDWNEAFMEAALAATGRPRAEIEAQLKQDYGRPELFQVRRNACNMDNVPVYAKKNGLEDILEQATDDPATQEIEPLQFGGLREACSALAYYSRERGLERPFTWQQIGDVRYSFLFWVHNPSPSGPLGYGPSGADPETGEIISGNAYVYGGAIDTYARAAADIVRGLNEDLAIADIIDGSSYSDWRLDAPGVADMEMKIPPEMQREISRRMGAQDVPGAERFQEPGFDKAAMFRHMQRRVANPAPGDPISRMLGVNSKGDQIKAALLEDPVFRSKMLSDEMLALLGPLYDWVPGEPVPDDLEEAVVRTALDPTSFREREDERMRFFAERNVYLADFTDQSIIGRAMELKGMEPQEVYRIVREEIFRGVMLHELGHTVGLRHNFKGSFDALNYFDDFWRIRESVPEAEWDANKLAEKRYSSIMDYGSRFNSDWLGLGKYDHAAIKFAYGHVTDVWDEQVPVPSNLALELEVGDYTNIPHLMGGAANLTARHTEPNELLKRERLAGVLANAERYSANPDAGLDGYWIDRTVPYHFCSDDFRGDLWCRTWDEGANHTEAVRSAIQRYWDYFVWNAYRRGREEGSFINGLFSRFGRVLEYLEYPWQFYSFYDPYNVPLRTDLLRASSLGINFVGQVLGTPEPGAHCYYEQVNQYLPAYFFRAEDLRQCQMINIPPGVGRKPYFEFGDDFRYQIDYIGTYYDKLILLEALFSTRTRFFRVPDQTDSRIFTVGYFNVFAKELIELVADMTINGLGYIDTGAYHQWVDGEGEIHPSLLIDPQKFGAEASSGGRPEDARRIFTSTPYNVLWQSMVLGLVYASNIDDQQLDFAEYMNVIEVGSGDARTWGDNVQVARFENPFNGQIYEAAQTVDGLSIAYQLVELAQRQGADWSTARRNYESNPESESFTDALDRATLAVERSVELLNDMRYLAAFGNWGNW